MKKTLISFVGKGQKLKGAEHQAYVKTVYDFGEGIKYETSCFANAIRSSGKYNFDEVIFIGTDTSAWSTLLEEDPNSNELWLKILENEEEEKPIYEYEKELEDALTKLWQKR